MPAILYPVSKTVKMIKATGFSGRTGIPAATDDGKGLAVARSKKMAQQTAPFQLEPCEVLRLQDDNAISSIVVI
jgi:hypothetical protein